MCSASGQEQASQDQVLQPPAPVVFADWKRIGRVDFGEQFAISFPSPISSGYAENDTVYVRVLVPDAKGPVPCVLLLHFWGAQERRVEMQIARELNRRGIAAALMALPYHLERTPAGTRSGDLAIMPDPLRLRATMLQSLQDARRTIDFLASRPEFRQDRVGIAGTSLGAIVATLVYGVDSRLTHAAFVLGGVDLAHLLWQSSRAVPQREALRRKGYTEARVREELQLIEPSNYLPGRIGGRSFVVGARYDTVVPPRSTSMLIEQLDKPAVLWLETGHYGGFFVQRRLFQETAKFFAAEFAGEQYQPPEALSAPTLRLTVQYNLKTGMDIGVGLDLWSTGRQREIAATAILTPRGARIFVGRRVDRSLSFGVSADVRGGSVGAMWSTVL